jgi:Pectate lyase superfamily protein
VALILVFALPIDTFAARAGSSRSSGGYRSYKGAKAIDGDTFRHQGHEMRAKSSGRTRKRRAAVAESVNVKTNGAVGDGITDDTTAIQNAINSAQTSGKILWFPTGTYKVTAQLNITNRITIMSAHQDSAVILYTGTTGDLIRVNTINAVHFEKITLQGQTNPTNDALVNIDPAIAFGNFRSVFRDVVFKSHFNGIEFNSANSWTLENCYFDGNKNIGVIAQNTQGVLLGRNNITGCRFIGPGTGTTTAILMISGASLRVTDCFFFQVTTGFNLNWNPGGAILGGDLLFTGNHFSALTNGIALQRVQGTFANVHITGNEIHAKFPIFDTGGNPQWLSDLTIVGNQIFPLTDGIGVSLNANGWLCNNNVIDGGGETNTVGVNIGVDASQFTVDDNVFSAITTPIVDSSNTAFGKIVDNMGVPVVANQFTVGESVFTYTAGHRRETFYIAQSSGNVTITQGGQTIVADLPAAVPVTVNLEPNEVIFISWTINAPVISRVIH